MAKPDNVPVELQLRPGVPEGQIYAEGELQPHIRHAALGAKTRRGTACASPSMRNGRCRMHGGKSTGAPKGNQNALKHGLRSARTKAAVAYMRAVSMSLAESGIEA